eukprot:230756_1
MPSTRTSKKCSNNKSKSTPSKSPQAMTQLKRANSKLDYIVNARDVMSLKFVRNASDLDNLDGFFSPVYVHQLFTNEKIIGYRDLQIRVFFSQPALHCYIEIDYNEKLKHDDTTDIVQVFKKWMKAGFTQNKQQFIQKLDEEFTPPGELQCHFIRPDDNGNDIDLDLLSDADKSRSILDRKAAEKTAKSESRCYRHVRNRNTPRSNRRHNTRDRRAVLLDEDSESDEEEELTPRNARLLRRKRRLSEMNDEEHNTQPKKRRKLTVFDHNDTMDISDAEDQKKDCIQNGSNDHEINGKKNEIINSKFDEFSDVIYEIRIGSFGDSAMREFHLRLQFFVLLYIESSSFLDVHDEIWEVMVLLKRHKKQYETVGYLTLYKFFAFPHQKRLRISQVMMFPPFQRKGLGFEALQHVYKMAQYRDFIEVNVEDPGEGFQMLRDTTDVFNAYCSKCFDVEMFGVTHLTTYHKAVIEGKMVKTMVKEEEEEEVSYSPNTRHNKKRCATYDFAQINADKPLFPYISQHKKLSKGIYHEAIMDAHKVLRITPEQARIAYECLKWEDVDRQNDMEWKLYSLDVKRRLYAALNLENIHNYDESGIFARLTQDFNGATNRYVKILKKRDEWIRRVNRYDWDSTHEYPIWIHNKLKMNYNKKTKRNKKRRR